MRQRKTIFLQYLLSLLLVICLTAGCVAPARPQASAPLAKESAAQESPQSYEQYEKKTIDAQASFDQLTNDLFLDEVDNSLITLHYTLADPAAYGITDYDKTLGTVSLEDSKQALNDAKSLKVQLNDIDSRLLREDQLLTYNILSSYLNTMLDSEELELYDQPLSSSLGIQAQLPILLSEYVFYNKQDVEDYLSLLSSIDTYYDSIIAFEKEKADAGLGLCDTVIDRILKSCNAYLLDADHSFMAETFAERLEQVEGLTKQEKEDFIARNHTAIDEHFVPAYQKLIEGLTPLKGTGTNDKGLYYFPQGKKYYQYLVNSYTGTSYQDIPALKKAMSGQMMDDLTAMDELLTENPALAKKLYSYSFALTDPNQILEDLRKQCAKDFPAIEDYTCSIKNVPAALEALGQVSDQPFPDIRDFNQVHDLLYGVHTPWFRQFFNTGRKLQVFVHGHVHIQRRNLRQIPDAFFCGFRLLQYVVAVYDNLALCGAQITGHDVHGSGLPGAVRAQEAVYLAVFHPETQMVHCQMAAVIFHKIFYFNHCLCPPVSFL